ncbi:Protein of unknown function [Austwickia chelonae]|uniref:DUF3618 domain-containing protein n=1 Tax=Austwickia chelonae NBRC 105200 TaxID=1184607 RepID=K6VK74_9MICO|nr:DUF3618 domain-containing protein [Austwickia chelonae]GAB77119.1 hypothetical protein AUCHE_05_00230 [Austwickia chelonae NBRC 105200]SEW03208.1 Protein of unknown function [Austwickia chelonae]
MSQEARNPHQIEADIEATRTRLATTIDELAYRAKPGVIAQRQKDATVAKLQETFMTPKGDFRMERVAIVAAAVILLVGIGIMRRSRG